MPRLQAEASYADFEHGGAGRGESGSPSKAKLAAVKLIEPLQHGALSPGLSGLYSIVNAIRLTLAHKHHFSNRELADMVSAGLRFMEGRLSPERAVTCGLPSGLWLRLTEALIDRTRRRTCAFLLTERVFVPYGDRTTMWSAIELEILRGRPMLMMMQGGRYTVVSGFTPTSLLLFDSGGGSWIAKAATGVPRDCLGAKHVTYPGSFLTIRA